MNTIHHRVTGTSISRLLALIALPASLALPAPTLIAEVLSDDGHELACDSDESANEPLSQALRLGEAEPGILRFETVIDNPSDEKLMFSAAGLVVSPGYVVAEDLIEFGFLMPRETLPLSFKVEDNLEDGLYNVEIGLTWRPASESEGTDRQLGSAGWVQVKGGKASLLTGAQTLELFADQLSDSEIGRGMGITAEPTLRADVMADCDNNAACQLLKKLPPFAPGDKDPAPKHLTASKPSYTAATTADVPAKNGPSFCRQIFPTGDQISFGGRLVARETRGKHSSAAGSRVLTPPAAAFGRPTTYRVPFGHAVVRLTAIGIDVSTGFLGATDLGEAQTGDQGCWTMVADGSLLDRFEPDPMVWPTVVYWHPDRHAAVLGSAGRQAPFEDHGTTDSANDVGGQATFSPYAASLISDMVPVTGNLIGFGELTVNPQGAGLEERNKLTAMHLTQTLMHIRMDELEDEAAALGSPAQGAISDILWNPEPWVGQDHLEIVGRLSTDTHPAKPCHKHDGQSWSTVSNITFSNSDFCMVPGSTNHGTGHEIGHVVFKRALKWKGHDPQEASDLVGRIEQEASQETNPGRRADLEDLAERVGARIQPAIEWKHLSVRRMSEDLPFCKCCDLDWWFDGLVRVDRQLFKRSTRQWTGGHLNEIWPSFFSTVVHWEPHATQAYYATPVRQLEGFDVNTSSPGVGPIQYTGDERCFGPPTDLDPTRRENATARNIGNILAGLWDLYDSVNEGDFPSDPSSGGDDPAQVPFAEMLHSLASTPLGPPAGADLLDATAWNRTLYEFSAHPVTACNVNTDTWNCVDPIAIVDDALGSIDFDPTSSFHRFLTALACTAEVEQQCSMVPPVSAATSQTWRRCGDGEAYNMNDYVANLVDVASAPGWQLWRSGIQHNCMSAMDSN